MAAAWLQGDGGDGAEFGDCFVVRGAVVDVVAGAAVEAGGEELVVAAEC